MYVGFSTNAKLEWFHRRTLSLNIVFNLKILFIMNNITFVIPSVPSSSTNKLSETDLDNGYTQIAPNVYKFIDVNANDLNANDIIDTYTRACEFRKKGQLIDSINLFTVCEKATNKIDINIQYEIYVNLALLHADINSSSDIIASFYNKAIECCPDRAEPYYYYALQCNKNKQFNKSYELLKNAITLPYYNATKKYQNVQKGAYGKFLYDELSVACYWTQHFKEGIEYIEQIINDPDFQVHYTRINKNLDMLKKGVLSL